MSNKVEYIIIHHEAAPFVNDQPRVHIVNDYHRLRGFPKSSLGWFVGYHIFIERDGDYVTCRTDTDEGAHTKGMNFSSLGICMAGNTDLTPPTQAQVATLRKLINEKAQRYGIPKERVVPHRRFTQTTCYGRTLADNWAANMHESVITITPSVHEQLTALQKALAYLNELFERWKRLKVGKIDTLDHLT